MQRSNHTQPTLLTVVKNHMASWPKFGLCTETVAASSFTMRHYCEFGSTIEGYFGFDDIVSQARTAAMNQSRSGKGGDRRVVAKTGE